MAAWPALDKPVITHVLALAEEELLQLQPPAKALIYMILHVQISASICRKKILPRHVLPKIIHKKGISEHHPVQPLARYILSLAPPRPSRSNHRCRA